MFPFPYVTFYLLIHFIFVGTGSPVKMETNSEEIKSEFGDVYNADTDVDEEAPEEKIKPSCSGITDTFVSINLGNENKKTKAPTFLDSMSFLDPTIPFDPK